MYKKFKWPVYNNRKVHTICESDDFYSKLTGSIRWFRFCPKLWATIPSALSCGKCKIWTDIFIVEYFKVTPIYWIQYNLDGCYIGHVLLQVKILTRSVLYLCKYQLTSEAAVLDRLIWRPLNDLPVILKSSKLWKLSKGDFRRYCRAWCCND